MKWLKSMFLFFPIWGLKFLMVMNFLKPFRSRWIPRRWSLLMLSTFRKRASALGASPRTGNTRRLRSRLKCRRMFHMTGFLTDPAVKLRRFARRRRPPRKSRLPGGPSGSTIRSFSSLELLRLFMARRIPGSTKSFRSVVLSALMMTSIPTSKFFLTSAEEQSPAGDFFILLFSTHILTVLIVVL